MNYPILHAASCPTDVIRNPRRSSRSGIGRPVDGLRAGRNAESADAEGPGSCSEGRPGGAGALEDAADRQAGGDCGSSRIQQMEVDVVVELDRDSKEDG